MNHADPWPSNTNHLDQTTTMKSSLLVTQTKLYPERISPSHHLQKYLSSEKHRNPFFSQKGWTARYDCNRNTSMNQVTLARYKASRLSEGSEWLDNDIVIQSKWVGKIEKTVEMVGKEIIEFKWFGIISQTYWLAGQNSKTVQIVWQSFIDTPNGWANGLNGVGSEPWVAALSPHLLPPTPVLFLTIPVYISI